MNKIEYVTHRGVNITVRYVTDAELPFYIGFAFLDRNLALVRVNLPRHVQRFVRAHELHHVVDKYRWGGWLGGEIRATLVPGLTDPIGMFAIIWFTILHSRQRMKTYLARIFLGGKLPESPKLP